MNSPKRARAMRILVCITALAALLAAFPASDADARIRRRHRGVGRYESHMKGPRASDRAGMREGIRRHKTRRSARSHGTFSARSGVSRHRHRLGRSWQAGNPSYRPPSAFTQQRKMANIRRYQPSKRRYQGRYGQANP